MKYGPKIYIIRGLLVGIRRPKSSTIAKFELDISQNLVPLESLQKLALFCVLVQILTLCPNP